MKSKLVCRLGSAGVVALFPLLGIVLGLIMVYWFHLNWHVPRWFAAAFILFVVIYSTWAVLGGYKAFFQRCYYGDSLETE